MLQDIPRLPRSISESKHWTPDWRNRQAMAYLAAYEDRFALESGEGAREGFERALSMRLIRFAEWEDDQIVKARFLHAAGSPSIGPNWTAAFNLGGQLISTNPETLEAASIKARLLASRTDEDIAARHRLTPFQVMVFHNTWFDVHRHLLWPQDLLRVICGPPPTGDVAEWERCERKILWIALACGSDILERFLASNGKMPDFELEFLAKTRRRISARAYPNGGWVAGRGSRLIKLK